VLICVSLVASFTFYIARSDVPELTAHNTGPDDNIISFAHLDTPPDSQLSGMGPGEELASLNISAHTSDGFELSWELEPHKTYDGLVVECRGALPASDQVTEFRLRGDSTGSRIRGLNASTEYQIVLHGITGSKRYPLLEAVAVTGIRSPLARMLTKDDIRSYIYKPFSSIENLVLRFLFAQQFIELLSKNVSLTVSMA